MKENDTQTLKFTCVVRDHREDEDEIEEEVQQALEVVGNGSFDFEEGIDDSYVTFVGNNDVMEGIDHYQLYAAHGAIVWGEVEAEGCTKDGDCVIVEGKDDAEIMARVAFAAGLEW